MSTEAMITSLVTVVVALILGFVAKKVPWISNNLIPVQNLVIGLVIAIIYWFITKDFELAIVASGLLAGGAYDIVNNLRKIGANNGIQIEDTNTEPEAEEEKKED